MILLNTNTKRLLHDIYRNAVLNSSSGTQVLRNVIKQLEYAEIDDEDSEIIDSFIDGIRWTIGQREMHKDMEKMIVAIKTTLHYLSLWINPDLEVEFTDRIKKVKSSLEKILSKSLTPTESVMIHDNYGIRGIMDVLDDEELAIQHIYDLYDAFFSIVARRSKKKKQEFESWLVTQDLSAEEKKSIALVFNCPFGISFRKDFIQAPKPNGYKSLQFTLSIPMYSQVLPGAQVEIQLRTSAMHFVATEGTAKHEYYKEELLREVKGIFTLDDLQF